MAKAALAAKEKLEVQKEYAKCAEKCKERSREIGLEVKIGQAEVEDLEATGGEEILTIGSLTTKVEELGGSLASDEGDPEEKEAADFVTDMKESMETVDMLKLTTGTLTAHATSSAIGKIREVWGTSDEMMTKDQDVRHKTKESRVLDKSSGELHSDRPGVQAELDPKNEYLTKPDGQCEAEFSKNLALVTGDEEAAANELG